MMQVKEKIISNGHGSLSPSYVCIHETANPGATALNHVSLWSRDDTYAVHYVMDWTQIAYHCVPDDRLCWQVGNGNGYVVGIELCHATNSSDFAKVWDAGVEWAAWMLKKRGWGIDRLISHDDARRKWGGTDHTDPIGYFREYGKSWDQFVSAVKAKMNGGKWIKQDGKWWYRHADGSYTTDGWEKIDGKWYYFDNKGWMETGWVKWKGKWYWLSDSGAMVESTCVKVGGKWYAFDSSGAMYEGSIKLDSSGAMKL